MTVDAEFAPDPDDVEVDFGGVDWDGDGDIDADDLALGEQMAELDAAIDGEADARQGLAGKFTGGKAARPSAIIAVVGVTAITGTAVAALAYELVIAGSETSAANLGQLSALGLGALVAVAGAGKNDRSGD